MIKLSKNNEKKEYETLRKEIIGRYSRKKTLEEYRNYAKQGLWKEEKKLFNKYLEKGSLILDLACGSGREAFPLVRMGHKVIGIDNAPPMIRLAKELSKKLKIKVDFKIGDATDLKFKDNKFDAVIILYNSWNFISGENNRLKCLEGGYRVLKPGGYFIFSSHIRRFFSKEMVGWIKQLIKMYFLRYFGYPVREVEWGDVYYKNKEKVECLYIHKPSLSKIKKQLKMANFNIMEIMRKIKKNYGFFVCKKPDNLT